MELETKTVSQLHKGDVTAQYGRALSRRGHRVHFEDPRTHKPYWYTFNDLNHLVVVKP